MSRPRTRTEVPCAVCGALILRSPARLQGRPTPLCSRECTAAHKRAKPDDERFWSKVEKTAFCWLWTGSKSAGGYGILNASTGRVYAHRFSWSLHGGEDPTALVLCHTCDVRNCVRPDHLFLGTDGDNVRDAMHKGRLSTKLTDDEVRAIRAAYAAGGVTQRDLAAQYRTAQTNISAIVRGVTRPTARSARHQRPVTT